MASFVPFLHRSVSVEAAVEAAVEVAVEVAVELEPLKN